MYQKYNSILNPLEKDFQRHAVTTKRSNTLAYIAYFALGAIIGILVYRWINSDRNEKYDFEVRKND
jgi:hypothetical protein